MTIPNPTGRTVTLTEDEAIRLLETLDMLEELLSLVEGPMNGETGGSVHRLFAFVMDYGIVAARMPLHNKMREVGIIDTREETSENADDTKA